MDYTYLFIFIILCTFLKYSALIDEIVEEIEPNAIDPSSVASHTVTIQENEESTKQKHQKLVHFSGKIEPPGKYCISIYLFTDKCENSLVSEDNSKNELENIRIGGKEKLFFITDKKGQFKIKLNPDAAQYDDFGVEIWQFLDGRMKKFRHIKRRIREAMHPWRSFTIKIGAIRPTAFVGHLVGANADHFKYFDPKIGQRKLELHVTKPFAIEVTNLVEWNGNAFHLSLSALKRKLDSMQYEVENGARENSSTFFEQIEETRKLLETDVIEEITVIIKHAGCSMLIEGIPDKIFRRHQLYKQVIARENGEDPTYQIAQGSNVLNWAISEEVPTFTNPQDIKFQIPRESHFTTTEGEVVKSVRAQHQEDVTILMEIAKRNGIYEDELSADQIRMVVADHPKTEQLVGNFENVQTAARNVQLWFTSEWIRNRFYDAIKRDPVAADFTIHIDSHCNSLEPDIYTISYPMLSDEGKTLIPFDFEYKFDIGHNIDEQIAKASNEAVGQEHIVNAVLAFKERKAREALDSIREMEQWEIDLLYENNKISIVADAMERQTVVSDFVKDGPFSMVCVRFSA